MDKIKASVKAIFQKTRSEKIDSIKFEKAYKSLLKWARQSYGSGSESDLLSSVEDAGGGVVPNLEYLYKSDGKKGHINYLNLIAVLVVAILIVLAIKSGPTQCPALYSESEIKESRDFVLDICMRSGFEASFCYRVADEVERDKILKNIEYIKECERLNGV